MGHLVRFLMFQGGNQMGYLDYLICASGSARVRLTPLSG
jgi:hypothetical protein